MIVTGCRASVVRQAWVVFGLVLAASVAAPARGEADYEFAKLLMDRDEPSFDTDDLVERLAVQLEAQTGTKMDAKLIRATLFCKQAVKASLEKRKALLDEAEKLYREILAGDKTYRLYATAEKEAGTINSRRATTMMKTAMDLEKTNPGGARAMRAEAVATMGKIADGHKADADQLLTKFKDAYAKYKKWNDEVNKKGDLPVPPDMQKQLLGTFNPWLMADKRYIATKVEQIECRDDGDAAKKTEGEALAKLCETRANQDDIMEFPTIVAWYNYMRGRGFAATQNEAEAAKAWKEALDVRDEEMAPDQKKTILALKKLILHDLVKMKMHAKKYGDVEQVIVEAKVDPALRTLFDEDAGKELMIDYAKALTLPQEAGSAEYEKAIKELRVLIQKESKGGVATRWANDFSRTVAELLDDARTNKPTARPKLSAGEWYEAAHGFFLMGQQEYLKFSDLDKDKSPKAQAQFEKAYDEYQDAVDYYRRAIAEARSDRTDLPTRVEVESKSWFEMGLAYLKMRHYYEAIITYQAMRNTFLPENRKKWLGDLTKPTVVKPNIAKQVEAILADLDKPREGLNYKSGQNIAFALDKNVDAHRNPKDLWNQKLKPMIRGADSGTVADGEVTDNDYLAAKADMEEAKQLSAAGTEALKEDAKLAEESYTSSAKKYTSAGDKFLKVKPASPAFELALYQSGTSFTMAQALWVTGKARAKPPVDIEAQCKDLGQKALGAFDKYDDCIGKAPATKDEDKKRRQGLAGMVLLARNALYSGASDWKNVIKSSNEYLKWEEDNPQQKSSADVAYLNKYRALIELGANNVVPDCDEDLLQAEKTMRQWRKLRPKDNKVFVFMLNAVSRRYNLAAFQVEDFMKKGKKEGKTKDGKTVEYSADMAEVYEKKVAQLQGERVKMVEDAEGEDPTLEDYSRLVYLFTKTRMDREAADTAKKLLEKFDPENKSCILPPDDEKGWQALLTKMQSIIRYNDLNKWDRCKKDHMVLADYMYDTRQGLAQEKAEARPEFDKFNADMDNARKQLESIKKNYPDCQTLDPKLGEGGKAYLGRVEEEIDFRRKVEATRDLLFNKALTVAKKLDEANQPDEAKRYREVANAQLEILRKIRQDTPDMQIKQATISISIGEYAKALDTLNNVKFEAPEDSPLYFDASRMQSEVNALQKKWKEAAEYPEFTALTAGFEAPIVKSRWPEMKEFLKECYANGAPCPEQLKKLLKAKDDGAKTEEPKKEDGAKTEETKKEAPKADEKKADEKKADEKKAEAPAKADEKKNP